MPTLTLIISVTGFSLAPLPIGLKAICIAIVLAGYLSANHQKE